jgi:hypothetical protein
MFPFSNSLFWGSNVGGIKITWAFGINATVVLAIHAVRQSRWVTGFRNGETWDITT